MVCVAAPSREELQAFLLGSLSDEQSAEMIERIERHPACRAILDELSSSDEMMAARLKEVLPVAPFAREPELRGALARAAMAFANAETLGDTHGAQARADAAAPPLEFLREYRLLEKLGEGGMGAVYKARHTRLDKIVALKILPAERMKRPENVARFSREMKAVGRLDHPNIVRATDAGEFNGTHFLVMECVVGRDLSALQQERGLFRVSDACELIRQAAVGLQHAHEHGLVHRDLKPSNLILAAGGVKILDLGLARLYSDDEAGELTADGQVMGTADYIAPEQASNTRDADIRADIYSLGCTLYKLLAGIAPFGGPSHPTLAMKLLAHVSQPPPPIAALRPDLPPALSAVLDKMLAKDKERRYSTPAELAEALAPFCRGANLAALLAGPSSLGSTMLEGQVIDWEHDAQAPSAASHKGTEPEPARATAAGGMGQRSPGRDGRKAMRLACGAAGLAALVAAVLVIRVRTDDGELVIQSPDPDVQVTIKRNGQPVEDMTLQKGENLTTVRSGEIEVLITGAKADSYSIKTNKIALSRGRTETLTIERISTPPPVAGLAPEDANRQVAEWVVNHGGQVLIEDRPDQVIYVSTLTDLPGRVTRVVGLDFQNRPTPPFSEAELLMQLRRVRGEIRILNTNITPLTDAGLADLVKIPALARIRRLQIGRNEITRSGLSHLRGFPMLEYVALGYCELSDTDLRPLGSLPELRSLFLQGNRISDAGLAELRGLKLEQLGVQDNTQVADDGVAHLADMHSLRTLYLDGTMIGDRGLESLAGLSNLEILGIGSTRGTGKALAVVPRFKKLKVLGVESLPVTAESLDQFRGLPDLRSLGFGGGGMKFGPADLTALAKLKKLEELNFSQCRQVTDEWLVPLAQLGGLTYANFAGTKVTAAGVKKLHTALPRCRIVSDHGTTEPASGGELPPGDANRQVAEWVIKHGGRVLVERAPGDGTEVRALPDLPPEVSSLVGMIFEKPPAPPISETELLAQLRRVTGPIHQLYLYGGTIALTDAGLAEMARMPALALVDVLYLGKTDLTEHGLSQLRAFPDLEQLAIVDSKLTDADLRFLVSLPKLRKLVLVSNRLSNAGLASLRGLKLEALDVEVNPEITSDGIAPIADMHSLRSLRLSGTAIDDRALGSLVGLSDLEILAIGSTRVTETGLAIVPTFKKLKLLDIGALPVTGELLAVVSKLPELEELGLGGRETRLKPADLTTLRTAGKLKSLLMAYTPQMTDEWLTPLARVGTLTSADFRGTKVTTEGLNALHTALPRCRIVSAHGTIEPTVK